MSILLVSIVFISCQSGPPPCVNESKVDTLIRWGYHNSNKDKISAFEITADAKLYYVESSESLLDFDREFVDELNHEDYCNAQNFTNVVIMRTQTLNVPADLNRFVELIDSSKGMRIRAIWNPVHKTVGSRQYRLLYDSLMTLVPESFNGYLKSFN